MLETNVTAAYALARGAAAQMKRNGYGRIIMLSSSAAIRARAGDVAYITAKGAVESMTRALACEWAREGVLTNAIAPGPFATETNAAYVNDPALLAGLVSRSPVERWGQPDEIGPACVFLASPAASYINGVVLPVDGGITIHY